MMRIEEVMNNQVRTDNIVKGLNVRSNGNQPRGFFWKGCWRWVSNVEDEWVDTGEWWKGEGEKTFYRVISGSQVYELYYDVKEQAWAVYRVYD